jgi:hypothetical protein
MGLLGKLIKTAIHTATLPLDAAKDVITLGGSLIDEESAVIKKAKKIEKDIDDLGND